MKVLFLLLAVLAFASARHHHHFGHHLGHHLHRHLHRHVHKLHKHVHSHAHKLHRHVHHHVRRHIGHAHKLHSFIHRHSPIHRLHRLIHGHHRSHHHTRHHHVSHARHHHSRHHHSRHHVSHSRHHGRKHHGRHHVSHHGRKHHHGRHHGHHARRHHGHHHKKHHKKHHARRHHGRHHKKHHKKHHKHHARKHRKHKSSKHHHAKARHHASRAKHHDARSRHHAKHGRHGLARAHKALAAAHRRRAARHRRQARAARRRERRERRRRRRKRKSSKHHHAKARHHASRAKHHDARSRHHAKHGRHGLARTHKALAAAHRRRAAHHRRQARAARRRERRERREKRRRRREERRRRRRASSHDQEQVRKAFDPNLPQVKCLEVEDVRKCTKGCKARPAHSCRKYCHKKFQHWAALRTETREQCSTTCQDTHHDTCIDECVQSQKAFGGCLPRPTEIKSNHRLRADARRRRRNRRRKEREERKRRRVHHKHHKHHEHHKHHDHHKPVGCNWRRQKARRAALRAQLHRLTAAAAACGDTDVQCVDVAYRRIGALKRRIHSAVLKFHRNCGGPPPHSSHAGHRVSCKHSHFEMWLSAQEQNRKHLQKMASKCESDDRHCVRSYMKQLLEVSRAIRTNAKRCKRSVHLSHVKKEPKGPVQCPPWIHASAYRHAITCDRINFKFRKWVKYQKCLRQRYFIEAMRCASDNIPCLRRTYHSIRRIQHRLSHGHDEFGVLISKCDECAPIKLRFRKWLLRERRRRHRAHLRACACAQLDVECLAENVNEIKSLQDKIHLRRHNVMLLSADCHAGWQKKHQASGLLPGQHTISPDDMKDIMGDFFITSTQLVATTADNYSAGQTTQIPDLPEDVTAVPTPAATLMETLPADHTVNTLPKARTPKPASASAVHYMSGISRHRRSN